MPDYVLAMFMPTNGFRFQAIDSEDPGVLLFSRRGNHPATLLHEALEQLLHDDTILAPELDQVRESIQRDREPTGWFRGLRNKFVPEVDASGGRPIVVQLGMRIGFILQWVQPSSTGLNYRFGTALDFDDLDDFWATGKLGLCSSQI